MRTKTFRTEDEYVKWLSHESMAVQEKARKFAEQFGNSLPVILVVDTDTSQTGESAACHIFIKNSTDLVEFLGDVVA
jgi:hypothetical protein